jgi:hypothetical protein
MAETVLLKYLKDQDTLAELHKFNQTREELYNSTMEKLGLEYRFKAIFYNPEESVDTISLVLSRNVPPTQSWWDDNCFFVNGYFRDGNVLDTSFAFCGYNTKYRDHWPLIQLTFQFVVKYLRYEYWYTSEETGILFWNAMETVLQKIKKACETDGVAEEDSSVLLKEVKEEFERLAKLADTPDKTPLINKKPRSLPPHWMPRQSTLKDRIKKDVRRFKAVVSLFLFERYKLRDRLVRPSLEYPASGDWPAFS